jgi:hypothetical protein
MELYVTNKQDRESSDQLLVAEPKNDAIKDMEPKLALLGIRYPNELDGNVLVDGTCYKSGCRSDEAA